MDEKWEDFEDNNNVDIVPQTSEIVPTGETKQEDTMSLDDVERQTLLMEERVRYMDRYMSAIWTLVRKITNDEDWTIFGHPDTEPEKASACLSADAALRIAHIGNLPIKTANVMRIKEDIIDKKTGKNVGYRWTYKGDATLHGRTLKVIGQYSSREAFLGKVGGDYRDELEINENHIEKAAHTHFKGNCVKDLLGINKIPYLKYLEITNKAGRSSAGSGKATHGSGTQGGVTDKQRADQDKLWTNLVQLAGLCLVVKADENAVRSIGEPKEETVDYIKEKNADPTETYARASLKAMTTFKNNKGNIVKGHDNLRKIKQKSAYMAGKELAELMANDGIVPEVTY
jgi:hypothetical protein